MNYIPWSIRGISDHNKRWLKAEAARRNITIGEWLNHILDLYSNKSVTKHKKTKNNHNTTNTTSSKRTTVVDRPYYVDAYGHVIRRSDGQRVDPRTINIDDVDDSGVTY